jgi:hypothetical protein
MISNGKRARDIREAFTALMPLAPLADAEPIRSRASRASMRDLPAESAVWLAAVAHIRHVHTDYDALLADGYERDAARFFVTDDINAVLTAWRATRYVTLDEEWPAGDDGP